MFEELNLEDLKKQQDEANTTKAYMGALGSVLNNVSRVPSSYEMLHGGKVERPDYERQLNQAASFVQDPLKQKSELAKAYLENRGMIKAQQEADDESQLRDVGSERSKGLQEQAKAMGINGDGLSGRDIMAKAGFQKDYIPLTEQFKRQQDENELKDPNSKKTKSLLALAPRWGLQVEPGMTGFDVMQLIDPKKMMETEAQRKAQIEGQKQMADYEAKIREASAKSGMARDIEKFKIEAGIKNEMGGEKAKFDRMPEDQKQLVEGLSKKNASKVTIASQIDSALKNADKLPDDQKLMQYRQMIKVLNSTEGQDAVGAEESKRLAGYLEYRLGNMTEPGAFIGRDLKGFKEQAEQTSNSLKGAMRTNQDLINKAMGRPEGTKTVLGDFASGKTIVKTQVNPKTGQTRNIYSDGSVEIVGGK